MVDASKELPTWQLQAGKLYKKFEFKTFTEAFAFMTSVAFEAEKMDHHPEWKNVYNTVEIWLSTHSADGITDKDIELGKIIDSILEQRT